METGEYEIKAVNGAYILFKMVLRPAYVMGNARLGPIAVVL